MPLSDIVNVQITRQTQTVSQAGFGTVMILGTHKQFNERIKYYSSLSEVGADFSPYMKEYIAAQDVFAQSPRPSRLAIGRRLSDSVTLELITAQGDANYTVTINSNNITIPSDPTVQESTVVLSADLILNNRIKVVVNGTNVGTITSVINFGADFASGDVITSTVNETPVSSPPSFTGNQATTIALVAANLATAPGITGGGSATVTGVRQITVVFAAAGNNAVTSVVSVGGNNPVATISEGGFVYASSMQATMGVIAGEMAMMPNIDSVDVEGVDFRTLVVHSDPNQPGIVNTFTVSLGVSQAVATITNNPQPASYASIIGSMVIAINALNPGLGVTASSNLPDNELILTAVDENIPFDIASSTDIVLPIRVKVVVDQAAPATLYTVDINGVSINYTSDDEVYDNETIADNLVFDINARGMTVTASNNFNGSFILSSSDGFTVEVTDNLSSIVGFEVLPLTALQTVEEDLDEINEINSDWYALAYTGRTKQEVLDIAAWVETQVKIFGTASAESAITNTVPGENTSLAGKLASLNYTRTFCLFHQESNDDFPECAWFGKCLPFAPGSETWKFKRLASVTASQLTTDQQNNALGKNCNLYLRVGGVDITQNGTMASGEFIDIIRGIDWLSARIQEFVYALLVNSPKVPYTNAGIASVEAEIRRALQLGIDNDFIATEPPYTVTVPNAATVSPANKAARLLTDVNFTATLAGAIHAVEIRGVVTV